MSSMKVSMIMEMQDRFSNRTSRITGGFDRIERAGKRSMRSLRSATDAAYRGLDRLGNRYTGFITGVGGAMAISSVTKMETRLKRLGIQANKSTDEMEKLHKSIIDTSRAADIRVDPSQILSAFEKIIEKTGDFELASSNIRNIGLAIQATGAEGADIGAMIADLSEKFDIKRPEELLETMDLLTNQGKAGAFTLQNFATQGERVTAAYSVTGRVTKEAAREMGAMLQMIRKGTGSSEMAATAFEALMRTMNDAQKRKMLGKAGIRITDPDDPKRMRSITEIVKDLVKATNGDVVKLSSIFDAEAMRALNIVAAEFSKTGGFESLDNFAKQASDGATIMKDAFDAADTSAAKWQTVLSTLEKGAFDALNQPISDAANMIGNTEPGTMDKIVKGGIYGAAGLGALAMGVKGHKMLRGVFGRGAKGGVGKALGAAAGMAGGIQPVMVMNWPPSLGMGSGMLGAGFNSKASKVAKSSKKLGRLARLGRFGKAAARKAPYVGAGLIALDAGSAALSGDKEGLYEAGGSLGGGLAGAAAGAAIGSVIPGLGTAIGGAIGGVVGSLGGGELAKWFAGSQKQELAGEIKIKVDAEGRPTVDASMNTPGVKTSVDQGIIMGGGL